MHQPYQEVEGLLSTGRNVAVFRAEATAVGKRRNDLSVTMEQPWQLKTWNLSSDECARLGGDEEAPMPLTYFAAGLVSCFMTQLRTFARHCAVEVHGLEVSGELVFIRENGPRPRDPYTAHPGRFRLDIDLNTPSPLAAQKRLVEVASRGCFVEAVLSIPVEHRLRTPDGWEICDLLGE